MIDAASILFPSAAPPVAPAAAAPARSTTPPAAAPAASTAAPDDDAANLAKIEKAFGFGAKSAEGQQATQKAADGADAKPAEGATTTKPAEGEQAKAEAPQFDPAHPDTATVAPVAKELGLDQKQVARLTALHGTLARAELDRNIDTWTEQSLAAFKHDNRAIADAKIAVRDYGTPELRQALETSGLGSHPAVLKFLVAVARGQRRAPGR
jgi:hypothetical protein